MGAVGLEQRAGAGAERLLQLVDRLAQRGARLLRVAPAPEQ